MSIKLKPHNESAYEKVKDKLRESNKVAVIHPTGTGKMYIALKMLEDNKGKKAIYAAPSVPILHDVKKSIFAEGMTMKDFPNLKRMTYQKLMKLSDEEINKLDSDIIILDEFHHCGAPEWGKGVERLMQRNPNANVLGLSATPLRYFDGVRDMADEMFDNNVASEMTLEEAIEQGILPEATYVSALYGYEADLENMESNISKIKDTKKKEEAQYLFNTLRQKLDESTKNLPQLLNEHMENKNGKYIIFCKNIDDMEEKMKQANTMFGCINPNIKVRGVSSKIKDNDKILSEFENDNDKESLKLLYAVNMLNEGYHIPDLDGVVMMRPTYSPTLFTQQLGRALTVGGNKRPVVLDLVNNFDTCKIIEDFAERMKQYKGREGTRQPNEAEKEKLSIFDKTKEFREIANKITELSKRGISLEEKIGIFEKYYEEGNEEINGQTMYEGYPIGEWATQIRSNIKKMNEGKNDKIRVNPTKEQIERLDEIGILDRQIDSTIDEKIDMLVNWMEKYPNAKIKPEIPEEILREYASNEEEYVAITKEYSKMQKYYEYVKHRQYERKLSEEQILKCKEGNLRGPFGYPTQIEELSKISGKSEETIDYIINNYETIENFKTLYREGKLTDEDLLLAKNMFRQIIDIDFNSDNKNFDRLYMAIKGGNTGKLLDLYSSEKLKKTLDTLTPKEKYIIERRFGLTEEDLPKNIEAVAQDLDVTRERIRQIEAKALRKLRHPSRENIYKMDFIEGEFSSKEKNTIINEKNRLLTEEERNLGTELLDNIFESNIVYSNNPYEVLGKDEKKEEIIKGIKFIKDRPNLIEKRLRHEKSEAVRELQETSEALKLEEVDITDLEFSVRTHMSLNRAGINSLQDITRLTEEELLKIKNIGARQLIEVKNKLEEYGLSLTVEDKDNNDNQEGVSNPSEIEKARAKRDELKAQMEELERKMKEAKDLMESYDKLLGEDKSNDTKNENPDFKD